MDDIKKQVAFFILAFSMLLGGCADNIDDKIIIESGKNEISLAIYSPDTLNPIRTLSDSVTEIMALVYEPLFEFTDDLIPVGCIAQKCVLSEDNTAASVFLNAEKRWHDGTPVTAYDIIYTINEIKRGKSLYKHNVEYIASAEAAADGSVYLTFYEPVMNLEGLLSFPVIKENSADTIAQNPMGTGKFKVQESGATRIIMSPSEENDESSVYKVSVSVKRNAQTCISAFETGELDAITSACVDLGEVTPGGSITFGNYTANFMTFLGFNCQKEIFNAPYVRLAIEEKMNRTDIVEKAAFSRGTQCKIPVNPQSKIYKEADLLEIDVEGAMNKAGFIYSDGSYKDENGNSLSLGILTTNENAQKVKVAEMIASQLTGFGIDAYTINVGFDEYTDRIKSGNFDMFVGEVEMKDNLDPGFLTSVGNYFGFRDDELDSKLMVMRSAKDTDTLYSAVGEYARVFCMNPPFVPLFYRVESVVYTDTLSGMGIPGFYNRLDGMEKWYFKADSVKGTY